jgi:hypothetical protein
MPNIFFENAHCLVTDTGAALADDGARGAYLALLEAARRDLGLKLPAYALLPGRALLYLVTPGLDLKAVMGKFGAALPGWAAGNCKYKLLQPEEYAAHLARYIHLEPVKEGLAARPEDYQWSSAAQYLGAEGIADKGLVLDTFSAERAQAVPKYSAFMAEPVPGKFWRQFAKNRDAVLGAAAFVAAHSPHLK